MQGDWGYSYPTHRRVLDMVTERLGNTLYLMSVALLLTLAIAVPVGIVSALRPYSWFDNQVTAAVSAGISMPSFWLGLLLIILFGSVLMAVLAVGSGLVILSKLVADLLDGALLPRIRYA